MGSVSIPTFSQVTGDVGKAVESAVASVGRSDIGKVVEAVTAPVRGTVKAAESLARGDIEGAGGNLAHAFMATNPINMAAAASSSVRGLYKNDLVNTLTLGYSKDAAEIVEKGKEASYGKKIDGSDWSLIARQNIRGAAIAGAVYAAPAAYAYAAEHATVSAGAAVLGALKDPKGAVANVVNSYVPGAGDAISDLIPDVGGGTGRSPASPGVATPAGPSVVQIPGSSTDMNMILIIGAVAIAGVAAVVLLKR